MEEGTNKTFGGLPNLFLSFYIIKYIYMGEFLHYPRRITVPSDCGSMLYNFDKNRLAVYSLKLLKTVTHNITYALCFAWCKGNPNHTSSAYSPVL